MTNRNQEYQFYVAFSDDGYACPYICAESEANNILNKTGPFNFKKCHESFLCALQEFYRNMKDEGVFEESDEFFSSLTECVSNISRESTIRIRGGCGTIRRNHQTSKIREQLEKERSYKQKKRGDSSQDDSSDQDSEEEIDKEEQSDQSSDNQSDNGSHNSDEQNDDQWKKGNSKRIIKQKATNENNFEEEEEHHSHIHNDIFQPNGSLEENRTLKDELSSWISISCPIDGDEYKVEIHESFIETLKDLSNILFTQQPTLVLYIPTYQKNKNKERILWLSYAEITTIKMRFDLSPNSQINAKIALYTILKIINQHAPFLRASPLKVVHSNKSFIQNLNSSKNLKNSLSKLLQTWKKTTFEYMNEEIIYEKVRFEPSFPPTAKIMRPPKNLNAEPFNPPYFGGNTPHYEEIKSQFSDKKQKQPDLIFSKPKMMFKDTLLSPSVPFINKFHYSEPSSNNESIEIRMKNSDKRDCFVNFSQEQLTRHFKRILQEDPKEINLIITSYTNEFGEGVRFWIQTKKDRFEFVGDIPRFNFSENQTSIISMICALTLIGKYAPSLTETTIILWSDNPVITSNNGPRSKDYDLFQCAEELIETFSYFHMKSISSEVLLSMIS